MLSLQLNFRVCISCWVMLCPEKLHQSMLLGSACPCSRNDICIKNSEPIYNIAVGLTGSDIKPQPAPSVWQKVLF